MSQLLHDISLFTRLVLSGWEQYAEAGVTGLLIYLVEKARKGGVSWRILGYTALAFLVFAFFNVWREQYYRANHSEEQLEALRAENTDLHTKVQQLSPPSESPTSLRRRTLKLADELQRFLVERYENPKRPPVATPDSRDPNPSDERKKEIKLYIDYEQVMIDMYMTRYKDRMVGIIKEYESKAFRPPIFSILSVSRGKRGEDAMRIVKRKLFPIPPITVGF